LGICSGLAIGIVFFDGKDYDVPGSLIFYSKRMMDRLKRSVVTAAIAASLV